MGHILLLASARSIGTEINFAFFSMVGRDFMAWKRDVAFIHGMVRDFAFIGITSVTFRKRTRV
jgi:hypothetical protein